MNVTLDRSRRRAKPRLARGLVAGAAAGAAGTTALDAVTYLDMLVRGRPASSTPVDTAARLSDRLGVPIPGDGGTRQNRLSGLGPLLGLAVGVGVGGLLGAARAAGFRPPPRTGGLLAFSGAMVAGNLPMVALGVSDPRRWGVPGWAADVVPHLVYGVVTVAVLEHLDARPHRRAGAGGPPPFPPSRPG